MIVWASRFRRAGGKNERAVPGAGRLRGWQPAAAARPARTKPGQFANWGLSPAKFRHVSSVQDVKAQPTHRAKARKPPPAQVSVAARASAKSAPRLVKQKPARTSAKTSTAKPAANESAVKAKLAVAPPKNKTNATASKPVSDKAVAPRAAALEALVAKPSAGRPLGAKPAALKSPATKPAAVASGKSAPLKPPAAPAPARAVATPQPKKAVRKSIKEAAGVSTDAVARRTGKSWDDWFEVLDSAGAATLDQRGVIAILAQKHGIGPWWQQMIAVGYESVRGKSDKPAASDGFRINSNCTLDAPLARVFRLWNDAGERARWLADDRFVVRGTTADKSIRARWGKGTSQVAVSFSEKSGRTEVSVEHHQIESSAAAEQMKAYWVKKLGLLAALAPRR